MQKKHECVPIRLLRRVEAHYPQAWAYMDQFHALNGSAPDLTWPDWCWVPMAAAAAVVSKETGTPLVDNQPIPARLVLDLQAVFALATWRHSRQIFVMDPTLEKELISDQDSIRMVPVELLHHLPYPGFYVQTAHVHDAGNVLDGFFVSLEFDVNNGEHELRFLAVSKNLKALHGIALHITNPDESIEDAFRRYREIDGKETARFFPGIRNAAHPQALQQIREALLKQTEHLCRQLLPLVVYICSTDNDVAPGLARTGKERRNASPASGDVATWNVGFRIGPALERYRKNQENQEKKAGNSTGAGYHSPKRPHIRRAHYHHFWTGSGGNRHLVVKWIPPIFVNAADGTELPVVGHRVNTLR